MSPWVTFRVEVATNDLRDATPARIQAEVLRALEHRFSAVTVEQVRLGGWDPQMACETGR